MASLIKTGVWRALLLGWFLSMPAAWAMPAPPPVQANPPASTSGTLAGVHFVTLPASDLSYQLLVKIFGPTVTSVANGQFFSAMGSTASTTTTAVPSSTGMGNIGTVMGAFFSVYNSALLAFVAVWILWQSLTGILHTAHSGEWLGKKISGFWAPIRMTLSMGMLLPVAGGYSLIQGLVLLLAVEGAGFASHAAVLMASAFSATPVISAPAPPSGPKAAAALLADETCFSYLNNHYAPMAYGYSSHAPALWYADEEVKTYQATQGASGTLTTTVYAPNGAVLNQSSVASSGLSDWVQYSFVRHSAAPGTKAVCGSIKMTVPLTLGNGTGMAGGLVTSVQNPVVLENVRNQMFSATINGFNAMATQIVPMAGLLAAGHVPLNSLSGMPVTAKSAPVAPVAPANASAPVPPPGPDSLSHLIPVSQVLTAGGAYIQGLSSYDSTVATAATQALRSLVGQQGFAGLVADVQTNGWLSMGTLWLSEAQYSEALDDLTTNQVAVVPPHPGSLLKSTRLGDRLRQSAAFSSAAAGLYQTALSQQARAGSALGVQGAVYAQSGNYAEAAWQGAGHGAGVVASKVEWAVSDGLSRILMGLIVTPILMAVGTGTTWTSSTHQSVLSAVQGMGSGDPLIKFMLAGHLMIEAASGLLIVLLAIKGLSYLPASKAIETGGRFFARNGSMVTAFIVKSVAILGYMVLALLGMGFLLGIYLPAIPMIAFFAAAIGWIVSVAEALIAAPLWAVLHADLEEEGWAPNASRQGYQLVSGMMLRPIMIVGALWFSMAMISGIAWLLGKMMLGFMGSFDVGQTHQTLTSALDAVGLIVLMIVLLFHFAHIAAEFVHKIPDAVLRWIGGGGDSLGAGQILQSGSHQVFGAVLGGRSMSARQEGVSRKMAEADRGIKEQQHAAAGGQRGGENREPTEGPSPGAPPRI
ncbi:MAG: DotA/TraY family protein [Acidobacteriaceae bacterium]